MLKPMEIIEEEQKSEITETILRALPEWFGIEEAIVNYIDAVRKMPFFAIYDDDEAVGFVAIKNHNPATAEVYVMGVREEDHRRGIGSRLMDMAEGYCRAQEKTFLTVKTLDESRESEEYKKTRKFYLKNGFQPLEVFPTLWGEENPCLFLAKIVQ